MKKKQLVHDLTQRRHYFKMHYLKPSFLENRGESARKSLAQKAIEIESYSVVQNISKVKEY